MENVGIVDVNVFDCNNDLLWQVSRAAKMESADFTVNYNYPDNSEYFQIVVDEADKGMKCEISECYDN
jgi:hypothetical protein